MFLIFLLSPLVIYHTPSPYVLFPSLLPPPISLSSLQTSSSLPSTTTTATPPFMAVPSTPSVTCWAAMTLTNVMQIQKSRHGWWHSTFLSSALWWMLSLSSTPSSPPSVRHQQGLSCYHAG
ncbi:hypothetical protein E2C01_089427 [Portunus trituberculatus]|uniref:Uncharacterized protein n=1 Tax=Portunus trituberculatus TaxID=210409 RepID=A0A5B7JI54_PORTR|nr:hypothetical protein [Portunus trituberculatus]